MLAVITDDYTGASEIAGIALDKGYRTVIEIRAVRPSDTDVLIVASNMRSLPAELAALQSEKLTSEILALGPEMIFKKVDSVLRGNIGPELEAQMRVEKKSTALLIPANPSHQRTIADGIYLVGNMPVAESGFALSHRYATSTSSVVDILKYGGASNASCISLSDPIHAGTINIGNAGSDGDLKDWVARIGKDLVPAGAADFFAALLNSLEVKGRHNGSDVCFSGSAKQLYLCGSNFPASREAVETARAKGICITVMPDEIYFNDRLDQHLLDRWASRIVEALAQNDTVIISASQLPNDRSLNGMQITRAMADVVRQVVEQRTIDELMIEGGATSQAVIEALNIECLYPRQSIAPGVTRMRVDGYPDLHITMKPGSYGWPQEIWEFGQ